MGRNIMPKEQKLLIRKARECKTIEEFLGMNRITKNSKIVWQANKEGRQLVGNKQFIRRPTLNDFQKEILPRTRDGWYGRGSVKKQYQTMLRKEQNIVISYIDTGEGWEVTRIAGIADVRARVQNGIRDGWAMVVDSFESPIATAVRKTSDSEQRLIDIWIKAVNQKKGA